VVFATQSERLTKPGSERLARVKPSSPRVAGWLALHCSGCIRIIYGMNKESFITGKFWHSFGIISLPLSYDEDKGK
jgi:hypothetical protein